MAEYKRYEGYRDSGVDYLSEIPNEWEVKPIKYLINSIQTGTTPTTKNEEYFDGEIQWFTPGDFVGNGELIESSRKISNLAIKDNEAKMFPENTIAIVGIGATVGKVAKMGTEGSFNQQVTGLVVDKGKLYSDYLYYWLDTNKEAIKKIANYTTLPIINNEFIKNYKCYVPNLNEQIQIANFLNRKISEIDSLIDDKKNLINLLEEKRQAIITEAVTKGLNPNVKMKESGVEWIGKVPHEWEVKKLKYIGEAIIGLTYSPNDVTDETGILVLRSSNVKHNQIVFGDNVYVNIEIKDKLITKEGDILICSRNGSRALIGKNAYISKDNEGLSFGAFMTMFRSRYNKYLSYVFNSTLFKNQSGSFLTSTVNQLTINNLYSFLIPIPTIEEQDIICSYLDVKTSEIDTLKTDIKLQIEKLKEYRQSLISEVVTGKIDVRGYCKLE